MWLELSLNLNHKKTVPQEAAHAGAPNKIDGLLKTEQGRRTLETQFGIWSQLGIQQR